MSKRKRSRAGDLAPRVALRGAVSQVPVIRPFQNKFLYTPGEAKNKITENGTHGSRRYRIR